MEGSGQAIGGWLSLNGMAAHFTQSHGNARHKLTGHSKDTNMERRPNLSSFSSHWLWKAGRKGRLSVFLFSFLVFGNWNWFVHCNGYYLLIFLQSFVINGTEDLAGKWELGGLANSTVFQIYILKNLKKLGGSYDPPVQQWVRPWERMFKFGNIWYVCFYTYSSHHKWAFRCTYII